MTSPAAPRRSRAVLVTTTVTSGAVGLALLRRWLARRSRPATGGGGATGSRAIRAGSRFSRNAHLARLGAQVSAGTRRRQPGRHSRRPSAGWNGITSVSSVRPPKWPSASGT